MIFIKQKSSQGRLCGGKKEKKKAFATTFLFCTTVFVLGGWPRSVRPLETKIVLLIERRSKKVWWRLNRFVTTRRAPAETRGRVRVCHCVTYRDIDTCCHMCTPCFLDVFSPHFLFFLFFPSLTALTCFRPLRLSVFVLARSCVYIKSCN